VGSGFGGWSLCAGGIAMDRRGRRCSDVTARLSKVVNLKRSRKRVTGGCKAVSTPEGVNGEGNA